MKTEPNEPITPVASPNHDGNGGVFYRSDYNGLTKREHFAGLAMQGLIANAISGHLGNSSEGVTLAIQWADDLIAELNR